MGFSYEDALDPLDYDFTGCPRADGAAGPCTGKGRVPEPSEEVLERFSVALEENEERLLPLKEAIEAKDQDGIHAAAEALKATRAEASESFKAAVADLCAGSPSRAQLDELPPRVFNAFAAWLTKELLLPKG